MCDPAVAVCLDTVLVRNTVELSLFCLGHDFFDGNRCVCVCVCVCVCLCERERERERERVRERESTRHEFSSVQVHPCVYDICMV